MSVGQAVLWAIQTFGLLAAFLLGAWVRQPFRLPARRPANNRETAEQDRVSRERERQQTALLNYSIADARRAAREGGGMK